MKKRKKEKKGTTKGEKKKVLDVEKLGKLFVKRICLEIFSFPILK